jgi:hypothetical protein
MDKQSDLLSNYVAKAVINNSGMAEQDSGLLSTEGGRSTQDKPSSKVTMLISCIGTSTRLRVSDVSTKSDTVCLQTLECSDSISASVSTASIRNISARSEETEFITAAMFKTFLDNHNKQMDTIQHSLDSLNYTYYDEYEDFI